MKYPKVLQNLIDKLSTFPSVGPKTAERYAFYLLKKDKNYLTELGQTIINLDNEILNCQVCQTLSETNPCSICLDKNRTDDLLCIVENTQDLIALEATKQYSGKYFVLGGLINTLDGIGPEELNIKKLISLIKNKKIKEIILALNFTLEGETTALYLSKLLKNHVKITRLARGLPAGSDLEYADKTTLSSALELRREIK